MKSWKGILITCVGLLLAATSSYAQRNADKGDRYFDINLFEEAIKYYELEIQRGTDRDATDHARKQIADCYRIMGNFEEAEEAYAKILKRKKNQEDSDNYLKYGLSLKASSKYAEAKVQFKKYIEMEPDDKIGPIFLQSCDSAQLWLDETIGKVANNVTAINKESSDMAPYILPNRQLVFSSARKGSKKAFISLEGGIQVDRMDLYIVDMYLLNGDSAGKVPKMKMINTPLHEGSATFSADGNEIYFTRTINGEKDYRNKVVDRLWVFYSKKDSLGNWTEPVSAFPFNSYNYSIGQPSLSADGKTIYFISDKRGGQGETDIYNAVKEEDGSWSSMENLGPEVNTFGHELFPYIAADGVLYFSSDSHPGMGQLDIFSAEFENGRWSSVKNLKPPYNSIGNDFAIVFDGKNKRGFFSSDRFNGVGAEDIYSFSEEAVPLTLSVNGASIQFEDTRVFDGLKYKLVDDATEEEVSLKPVKGIYTLQLENGKAYTLVAKKSFMPHNQIAIKMTRDPMGKNLEVELTSANHPIYVGGTILQRAPNDSINLQGTPVQAKVVLSEGADENANITTKNDGRFLFDVPLEPERTYFIRRD